MEEVTYLKDKHCVSRVGFSKYPEGEKYLNMSSSFLFFFCPIVSFGAGIQVVYRWYTGGMHVHVCKYRCTHARGTHVEVKGQHLTSVCS